MRVFIVDGMTGKVFCDAAFLAIISSIGGVYICLGFWVNIVNIRCHCARHQAWICPSIRSLDEGEPASIGGYFRAKKIDFCKSTGSLLPLGASS